jgi:DNA-binding PadR family transcriptional regulator
MAAEGVSLTEHVVLALIVEAPAHGFAVSKELRPTADLGRVLTVSRPLIYRALEHLDAFGLIEVAVREAGAAGPRRTAYRATARGHELTRVWLDAPVEHIRDLRQQFLVKMRLRARRGLDSHRLITDQLAALDATLSRLEDTSDATAPGGSDDVVDRWRRHHARSVRSFLIELGVDSR